MTDQNRDDASTRVAQIAEDETRVRVSNVIFMLIEGGTLTRSMKRIDLLLAFVHA
jgi:hypothetical protein